MARSLTSLPWLLAIAACAAACSQARSGPSDGAHPASAGAAAGGSSGRASAPEPAPQPGGSSSSASAGARAGAGGDPGTVTDAGPASADSGADDGHGIAHEPCARDEGWCWAHGVPIEALHARSTGGAFAVGMHGTILEWTRDGWRRHAGVTREDIGDVLVAADDDVWIAAGKDGVLRYDGAAWRTTGVMGSALVGSGSNDVWVDQRHYDGQTWSEQRHELSATSELLVRAPGDAWVTGLSPELHAAIVKRNQGDGWQQVGGVVIERYSGTSLSPIRGELYVVANQQSWRLEGEQWVVAPRPVAAPDPADGVVLHDGRDDFVTVPADTRCTVAVRAEADSAFCHGEQGQLFHFDGEGWRRAPHDPFGDVLPASEWGRFPPALWAGGAELAWGSGPEHVLRVRNLASQPTPQPGAAPVQPQATLELYDGASWQELARGQFWDISGSGPDNVWIVGKTLLHHDGARLGEVQLPAELGELSFDAVHTLGPRATWVVAQRAADQRSLLLRFDGAWSVEREESMAELVGLQLLDVAGRAADDLWVLAEKAPQTSVPTPVLFHYQGGRWQRYDPWPWSTFRSLEVDAERGTLWLDAVSVPIAALAVQPGPPLPPAISGGVYAPFPRRGLWIGRDEVWLTTSAQAIHRRR